MNTVLYHTILNLHTSMLYCLFLFSLTSFLALFSCIQIIKCSFNVGIKSDLIKKNCWGIKGPFVPFTNFSKWNLIPFSRIDIERLLQYTRIIVKRRQYTLLIYVLIFIYDDNILLNFLKQTNFSWETMWWIFYFVIKRLQFNRVQRYSYSLAPAAETFL